MIDRVSVPVAGLGPRRAAMTPCCAAFVVAPDGNRAEAARLPEPG